MLLIIFDLIMYSSKVLPPGSWPVGKIFWLQIESIFDQPVSLFTLDECLNLLGVNSELKAVVY